MKFFSTLAHQTRRVDLNMWMMWSFPDDHIPYSTFLELLDLFPEEQGEIMLDNVDAKLANARLHPGSGERNVT